MNARIANITVKEAKIAAGIDRIVASIVDVKEKREVSPPGGRSCR